MPEKTIGFVENESRHSTPLDSCLDSCAAIERLASVLESGDRALLFPAIATGLQKSAFLAQRFDRAVA